MVLTGMGDKALLSLRYGAGHGRTHIRVSGMRVDIVGRERERGGEGEGRREGEERRKGGRRDGSGDGERLTVDGRREGKGTETRWVLVVEA